MPRNSSRTDSTVANLSDDALFDKLVSSDSVEEFSDTGVVVKLLRLLITKQDTTAKNVQKTLTTVASKTNKNATRLYKLESTVTNMDQYSRKPVAIFTGLPVAEGENSYNLYEHVINTLNGVLRPDQRLNKNNFVAIHRNGLYGHNGRPPSIIVKFLRYFEKDMFFVKLSV